MDDGIGRIGSGEVDWCGYRCVFFDPGVQEGPADNVEVIIRRELSSLVLQNNSSLERVDMNIEPLH